MNQRLAVSSIGQPNEARRDLNTATGKALEDRVSRTLVTSSLRGIVNKLLVSTIGGLKDNSPQKPYRYSLTVFKFQFLYL